MNPSLADLEGQLKALQEEIDLEKVKAAADVAGIADPTPASDAISGSISVKQGEWVDALLSGVAMIPYLGDLTKIIKAGRLAKKLAVLAEKAAELNNRIHKLKAQKALEAEKFGENAAQTAKKFPDELPKAKADCGDAGKIADNVGTKFKQNPLRQAYESEVAGLSKKADEMLAAGKSEEEVARAVHQARRDLGEKYKDATPEALREYIYDVNKQRYGDKLGPTYEDLIKRGKTPAEIIRSASKPNPDVDKLLSGFGDWLKQQDPTKLAEWASKLQ